MPRLKPPAPAITERRYYLRIEESRALTMEHDTESLGTDNLDHVVGQALQLIFKRDTQFESWLEQHPEPQPKPTQSKASPKRTAPTVIQRALASKSLAAYVLDSATGIALYFRWPLLAVCGYPVIAEDQFLKAHLRGHTEYTERVPAGLPFMRSA